MMATDFNTQRMQDIMAILRHVQNSGVISEAEKAEPGSEDQPQIDKQISDLMTTPKNPDKSAAISVESLGNDLGVADPKAFKSAFNTARAGQLIVQTEQIQALSDAFIRLMTADAGTTQRILNRLRTIYKKAPPTA